MHEHHLNHWEHSHDFVSINRRGEIRTKWVLLLTFTTMIVEIIAGMRFHSMALLADGWHMATHVLAFMIAIFAYRYSRVHEQDQTFAFSAAKVSVLGGFASSIALAMVAFMMMVEAGERLLSPQNIHFDEAIWVAVAGLMINLLSALILSDHHDHSHAHEHHHHEHHDHHHHHDHNLRAAYLHVLADALTSVLAIIALIAGKYYGLIWLDAVMGMVGSLVILSWAWGLIKDTSPVLLDQGIDGQYQQAIRETLESEGQCRVSDLHIWRVSPSHHAAIIVVVSQSPQPPVYYKRLLTDFAHLDHMTIEVNGFSSEEIVTNAHH